MFTVPLSVAGVASPELYHQIPGEAEEEAEAEEREELRLATEESESLQRSVEEEVLRAESQRRAVRNEEVEEEIELQVAIRRSEEQKQREEFVNSFDIKARLLQSALDAKAEECARAVVAEQLGRREEAEPARRDDGVKAGDERLRLRRELLVEVVVGDEVDVLDAVVARHRDDGAGVAQTDCLPLPKLLRVERESEAEVALDVALARVAAALISLCLALLA